MLAAFTFKRQEAIARARQEAADAFVALQGDRVRTWRPKANG